MIRDFIYNGAKYSLEVDESQHTEVVARMAGDLILTKEQVKLTTEERFELSCVTPTGDSMRVPVQVSFDEGINMVAEDLRCSVNDLTLELKKWTKNAGD